MPRLSYTKDQLLSAVKSSRSRAEALRHLQLCPTGGSQQVLNKYLRLWEIDVSHFESASARARRLLTSEPRPIKEVLVEHSTYGRHSLKKRLFKLGLKKRFCEMCGQGEFWKGKRMSLILDHVNGVRDDDRLSNLRIVCPNCAATLDTHCGRKRLSSLNLRWRNRPRLEQRKILRPCLSSLQKDVNDFGYSATGRKYGVTDNAVRKWIKFYLGVGQLADPSALNRQM